MSEGIAVENQWVPLNLKSVTGDLKKILQKLFTHIGRSYSKDHSLFPLGNCFFLCGSQIGFPVRLCLAINGSDLQPIQVSCCCLERVSAFGERRCAEFCSVVEVVVFDVFD